MLPYSPSSSDGFDATAHVVAYGTGCKSQTTAPDAASPCPGSRPAAPTPPQPGPAHDATAANEIISSDAKTAKTALRIATERENSIPAPTYPTAAPPADLCSRKAVHADIPARLMELTSYATGLSLRSKDLHRSHVPFARSLASFRPVHDVALNIGNNIRVGFGVR